MPHRRPAIWRQEQLSTRPTLRFVGPGARSDEEIDPEVLVSQAYDNFQVHLDTRPPQSVLVIERQVKAEVYPRNAVAMLNQVAEYISKQGERPSGKAFVRILTLEEASNRFESKIRFQAGYPVSTELAGENDISRRDLPGGAVVSALLGDPVDSFVRPFNAWPVIFKFAEKEGYTLDSGWGGNGGWQEFIEIPPVSGKGHESRLYLPVFLSSHGAER